MVAGEIFVFSLGLTLIGISGTIKYCPKSSCRESFSYLMQSCGSCLKEPTVNTSYNTSLILSGCNDVGRDCSGQLENRLSCNGPRVIEEGELSFPCSSSNLATFVGTIGLLISGFAGLVGRGRFYD